MYFMYRIFSGMQCCALCAPVQVDDQCTCACIHTLDSILYSTNRMQNRMQERSNQPTNQPIADQNSMCAEQVGWGSVNLVQISFKDLPFFIKSSLRWLKCVLLTEHCECAVRTLSAVSL